MYSCQKRAVSKAKRRISVFQFGDVEAVALIDVILGVGSDIAGGQAFGFDVFAFVGEADQFTQIANRSGGAEAALLPGLGEGLFVGFFGVVLPAVSIMLGPVYSSDGVEEAHGSADFLDLWVGIEDGGANSAGQVCFSGCVYGDLAENGLAAGLVFDVEAGDVIAVHDGIGDVGGEHELDAAGRVAFG